MALARARRRQYPANYWPGFVDMLSTLLLVVIFLMALFMVTNYIITQAASGKDTMLSRLNRQLSELTELLALERSKKESAEDNSRRAPGDACGQGKGEPAPHRTARHRERRRRESAEDARRGARHQARRAEEDHQRRPGQGRAAEPAARRAPASARLAERGARSLGGQGQGEPSQDRRSRPAAERGARQEGAGARPLPL